MSFPFFLKHILASFLLKIAQFPFLCLQFPQACDSHLATLALRQWGQCNYASQTSLLNHKVKLYLLAKPACPSSLLRALLSLAISGTHPVYLGSQFQQVEGIALFLSFWPPSIWIPFLWLEDSPLYDFLRRKNTPPTRELKMLDFSFILPFPTRAWACGLGPPIRGACARL